MPSKVVTAHTTAVSVATERKDRAYRVKTLVTDNSGGGAARTIRIQDIFTPAATNGVDTPTETTVDRWRGATILAGVDSYGEEDLKGVKVLGALKVIADAIDAGCYITVGYETE